MNLYLAGGGFYSSRTLQKTLYPFLDRDETVSVLVSFFDSGVTPKKLIKFRTFFEEFENTKHKKGKGRK